MGLTDKRKKAAAEAKADAARAEERRRKMMAAGPTRERSDSKRVPPAAPGADVDRLARIMNAPAPRGNDAPTLGRGTVALPPSILAAGAGLDPAGGVAPGPSPLDQYLAMLPEIRLENYVGPYDKAMEEARGVHAEAVPEIQSVYATLRDKLAGTQRDFAERSMGVNVQLQDLLGQRQNALQSLQQPLVADVNAQAGGELNPTLQAQLQGSLAQSGANLQESARGQRNLVDRLAQVREQSNADRIADAGGAESAALSNAKNNLGAILSQLQAKRAGAEQEYGQDVAERKMQEFQARQSYAEQQAEQARRAADDEKARIREEQAFEKAAKADEERYFKENAKSPRKLFEETWAERETRNPKAMAAFKTIVDNISSSGPRGRAEALATLKQYSADFASGNNTWNAELKPEVIADWINAYYDDEPRLWE